MGCPAAAADDDDNDDNKKYGRSSGRRASTNGTSVSHQGIVIPDTFGHDTHAELLPFPPRLSANDQRADGLQAFVSISYYLVDRF